MESRNNAILGRNSGMRASFGIIDLSILENEWQLLSSILAFPSSSKIFISDFATPYWFAPWNKPPYPSKVSKQRLSFTESDFRFFCTITRGCYIDYNTFRIHYKSKKKNRSTIYVEGEMCAVTAKGVYGKLSNRWCRHETTTNVQKEKENLKTQNLKSHLRFYTKTIEMAISSVGRDRSCYKIAFLIRREWFPRL